jgi:hypothetical protein
MAKIVKVPNPHSRNDVRGTLDDCFELRRLNPEAAAAYDALDKRSFHEVTPFEREYLRLSRIASAAACR